MTFKSLRSVALVGGLTLVAALLGGLVALSLLFVLWPPSNTWHTLPQAPQPAVRVVAGDSAVVFVEDADGAVYRCGLTANAPCWEAWPGAIQPGVDVLDPNRWPCPTDLHRVPPGTEAADLAFEQCVPGMMMKPEGAAFRVLADGQVEAWTDSGGSLTGLLAAVMAPIVGALVGGLIGLVLGIRLYRRSNMRTKTNPTSVG